LFPGSSKSEDKAVNEEGRTPISFCENLNLEMLNASREGDVEGKMTFISKAGACMIRLYIKLIRYCKVSEDF
jgi:hypothetical protein